MHDQIQRVIEGRYRGDNADGFFRRECPSALTRRREAHGNLAACERAQRFRRVAQAVDGSRHLDSGVAGRLAAFPRNECDKRLLPDFQQTGSTLEHRTPLMRLEPSVAVAHGLGGGHELVLEGIAIVCCHFRNQRAVEGLYHTKRLCHRHRSGLWFPLLSFGTKRDLHVAARDSGTPARRRASRSS